MGSFSIWHWLVVLLLVVFIYINYRYCKSYKLLLLELDPSVKPFNGNTAFLLFIPIVNIIWQVVLLIHIRNAIKKMKEKAKRIYEDNIFFCYDVDGNKTKCDLNNDKHL